MVWASTAAMATIMAIVSAVSPTDDVRAFYGKVGIDLGTFRRGDGWAT